MSGDLAPIADPAPGADILVVIPCLNERASLPDVVEAILADPASARALIVIADGGSSDGTRAWAATAAGRDARLVLLDNPDRLQAAAVNHAVEAYAAGRRWLVRVDAHADYPAGFISTLVVTAERTGAQSVVTPMATRAQGCFQTAAAAAQNSLLGTGGARHRWGARSGWVDHGHHALFELATFRRLGGYDARFAANEDAEYDRRLAEAGGRLWLAADCTVGYHPRSTPGALFRQYLRNGAGRAQMLSLHRQRPKLRQALPLATAPALALALGAPWVPWLALPALLWIIPSLGYGAWLGLKARCFCAALAGPAALIMHLAWSIGFWRRLIGAGATPRLIAKPAAEPSAS